MKIAGIVAEYDPFHLGHEYHLRRAKEQADYAVAVMSGWFTQRGRAACLSKYDRAKMALLSGADAVIELPALYAVRPAEVFARGGVELIARMGCDEICFGCETEDETLLNRMAELGGDEPESVQSAIRSLLDRGETYPRARARAYAEHLVVPEEQISQPNTLLAAEYIRAARGRLSVRPVKRLGDYHGRSEGGYLSASQIRALSRTDLPRALAGIPEIARSVAERMTQRTDGDDSLLYAVRNASLAALENLPESGEGIEHRIAREAKCSATREELAERIKCKRYTRARIDRILTQCLIGMTKELSEQYPAPPYARVVGVRRDAMGCLAELEKRSSIPIITRARDVMDHPVFLQECRAADAWSLTRTDPAERISGREYTEKLLII